MKTILNIIRRKKEKMMPLTMVKAGEPNVIRKVGGKEETRRFLENLGFVAGGLVTVVSEINGNMIVNVKESRVAIGKDMANKIMVG
jgi:ferrous iron transport protein A